MSTKRSIKPTPVARPVGLQGISQALYEQIRHVLAELRPAN